MIIIRNVFTAKPGQASKLAAQLKDAVAFMPAAANPRILTDLTGDFNQVVLELQAENLAGFEARLQEYNTNQEFREKMKGYTDLWHAGHREIFSIVK